MSKLIEGTYWGGWVSALLAVVYKLLITLGVCHVEFQVYPRHFWQLSFLLFLACVAGYTTNKSRA
jgi:hypothetical protein